MGGEDRLNPVDSTEFLVAKDTEVLPVVPVNQSHPAGSSLPTHTGELHPSEVTVLTSFYALWSRNLYFNIAACIFAPLGILSAALKWGDIPTFVLNFCAIIPLAKMLDFTTDQLSMRVGQTVGGLLNATFGNAVELIIAILALREGLLRVVQASIVGSMLSNLLLVLGLCFFCGGFWASGTGITPTLTLDQYQKFNIDKANVNTGLLAVVFLGFMIPAAFQHQGSAPAIDTAGLLQISRGTAVMLLITYGGYLLFTLVTNPNGLVVTPKDFKNGLSSTEILQQEQLEEEEEEEEIPETLAWVATFGLVSATVIIGILAELLVGSLEGLSEQAHLSQTFIGIIILPIVGNAAEHVTAVSSAMRNKMDLCISVAVGSSMQIALFVAPLLVLIGWMIGEPLTLDFEIFETAVLFVSIFVVSTLISDGRTHWLEGWMLLTSYVIIAIAFYFVKDVKD
ncbi:Sodium/calcium exchanger protein-domain-containing protein [Obelidium mucronatum]|nr:Sodium/calcium exchanger protein-domain-containing protein [Obelidium mucronatum]